MRIFNVVLIAGLLAAPIGALAQEGHAGHGAAGGNPVVEAYASVHETMMRDMAVEPTGDADVDFVRMMIPHHQGAIDMARVELQYGKDPGLRAMAEKIIAAQEAEIAELKAWLEAHKP